MPINAKNQHTKALLLKAMTMMAMCLMDFVRISKHDSFDHSRYKSANRSYLGKEMTDHIHHRRRSSHRGAVIS